MTAPRQILPGTTYLASRRCSHRWFMLRPSELTNQVFGFVLAVAAARFHVDVHAYCVMSNHFHLVVTDREARLPAFMRYLDSLVGRSMNALLGHEEDFWGPPSYSAVALQTPADVIDKVAYVLANPVAAGLVRQGRIWPGLWSAPERFGGAALEFTRPARFFRKKGATALPEQSSLTLVVPPGFESAEQFRRTVGAALAAREQAAASDLASAGRGFLGVARLLAQSPFGRPTSVEPLGGLNPRVACRDKWRRIQALRQLVEFIQDYRRAFARWRAGDVGAVFPAGTYLMRVLHGAACDAPG